ncbi:hypothetical protein IMZ16_01020 [Cruoricaptor ignavus]|uniref:Uncharacterized protein n=1 Tax=Cruoricaptor ignavus TaxID=1118202 RepID=A0A7M1T2T6_9FLAO|nr:hypothetical protein [Cruoricaptor ignavus]QOR74061.1 hypothetical protein IMZ16_01020 [Cruoricaptor ignavus]
MYRALNADNVRLIRSYLALISEQSATSSGQIEDLNARLTETEFALQAVEEIFRETGGFLNKEAKKREAFLVRLSELNKVDLSEEAVQALNSFQKKYRFLLVGIGVLVFSFLILLASLYFTRQFYSASIRSKSELRQEILDEIHNNGKAIYKIEDYEQLQHNTELMNKWMKKNPKDADKFLRFKDGYESK